MSFDLLCREIIARKPELSAPGLLQPDTDLAAAGIDSMTVVDLIMALAEHHGADLETALADVEPPRSLADLTALADRFEKA